MKFSQQEWTVKSWAENECGCRLIRCSSVVSRNLRFPANVLKLDATFIYFCIFIKIVFSPRLTVVIASCGIRKMTSAKKLTRFVTRGSHVVEVGIWWG